MAFMDLFKKKKDISPKSVTSSPRLEPVHSFRDMPKNLTRPEMKPSSTMPSREPNRPPENLPRFPIDLSKQQQPPKENNTLDLPKFDESEKALPRLESEKSVKDFISSESRKSFTPKFETIEPFENPRERIKPPSLEKLEGDFKTEPLFKGKIRSIDRPAHFDLHDGVKKPLFIRTDQFKDVKKNMNGLRETIKETDEIFYRVTNLKEDQDSELDLFHKTIEDIQRKLIYVDKTIFEKGG